MQAESLQPAHEALSTQAVSLPTHWMLIPLDDERFFAYESGLWTGKKAPLVECPVIRNTNFTDDGALDLSDVAVIAIEQRYLARKRLQWGDIIIERSGGGPQQPVGRVVFFHLPDGDYCFSNFTSRLRVLDREVVEPQFLHLYLFYFHISGQTERLQRRTTGIRNLAFTDYTKTLIPLPPRPEQQAIVQTLQAVQDVIQTRRREVTLERERKAALMHHLFTHGTRDESRKQTDIGEMPESWRVDRLGSLATVRYGLGQPPVLDATGVPMIRATDIKRGKIVAETVLRVRRDAIPLGKNPFLEIGDIIVVRSGAYTGDVAMYDGQWEVAIAGYDLVVSPNKAHATPKFLAQYLLDGIAQRHFRGQRDRSAQPHLNSRTHL